MDTNSFKEPHSITHITGNVHFKSNLSIMNVGKLVSEKLFGGLEFSGLENNYFEEVPGVLINNGVLGLQISIQETGNDGGTSKKYVLSISPMHWAGNDYTIVWGKLDNYLKSIFKNAFKDDNVIQLIEQKE